MLNSVSNVLVIGFLHYPTHRLDCKFFFEKEDPKTKKPIQTVEYDPKNCKMWKKVENWQANHSYKEFYNKFIKKKNEIRKIRCFLQFC